MSGTMIVEQPNQGRKRLRERWIILATVGALVSAGTVLAIVRPWASAPPEAARPLSARVELATGEVVLEGKDGEARLLSGTPLPDGALVRTADGARVVLRLSDGTQVYLDGATRAEVGAGMTLHSGRVWLDAPPLERGREPATHHIGAATLSLSDGGASLALEGDDASVYVADGLAVVTTPSGRIEASAGERVAVVGDAEPSVKAVAFWEDWTGGMADRVGGRAGRLDGSGTLYAVDREAPPGTAALPLAIQRQAVKVVVRDQIAETLVDQQFFNPSGRDVEGYYWFSIPDGSQLVGFALETDGRLVEGEIVERAEAKAAYATAVARRNDPALLEWVDEHTVRTRIFPVPSLGTRRIVIRYQQLLTEAEGRIRYTYPLAAPAGKDAPTIEEFALNVDLGELASTHEVATLGEARIEANGRSVTMRRSGYTPRADFQLELRRTGERSIPPIRLASVEPGGDQARYVMLRYLPEIDLAAVAVPKGEVVVVIDTSAAGDAAEHEARVAVAEALLRSLSADDRFALMSADVTADVLFPSEGLAEATPQNVTTAIERLADHSTGGATDLGAIFEDALARVHGLEQPALVYVGDGLATSGERGGEALAARLERSMSGSRARLFTVGVGQETDAPLLQRLARVGGGESLRVDQPAAAVGQALALSGALKTPTITDLELDLGKGLDDVFMSADGKLSRGDELVILARTHHDMPKTVVVRGRVGGEAFEVSHAVEVDRGITTAMVPRLWASAYVDRLLGEGSDAHRGKILSLGLEYGLMTPHTSFLALDSEQAYAQLGVGRRARPLGGMRLTSAANVTRRDDGVGAALVGALAAPLGCDRSDREAPPVVSRLETERKPDASPPRSPPSPPGSNAPMRGRPVAQSANVAPAEAEPQAEQVSARAPAAEPEMAADADMAKSKIAADMPAGARGGMEVDETPSDGRAKKEARAATTAQAWRDDAEDDRSGYGRRGAAAKPAVRRIVPQLPCSDASARSLAQRRALWKRRLRAAPSMADAVRTYDASAGSCEIQNWQDERTFVQLLQARAATEDDIAVLLSRFAGDPDAITFATRALLRRLVDPGLVAAVHNAVYGHAVDWARVDHNVALATDVEAKLAIVEAALARSPGDPLGERRLLELLAGSARLGEALARGRRLRDQGFMTPELAQTLGEALVASGQPEAAQRVFSEIVEFDPDNPQSRRLLGDVFLRHGWYAAAYRQYEDLLALAPEDASAAIRLARAAHGSGRTDEAIRVLRGVTTSEGRPGPDDPRRFARLHMAAMLASLHAGGDAAVPKDAVERELRRVGLFDAPATYTLALWEDLSEPLALTTTDPGGTRVLADAIVDVDTGIIAVVTPPAGLPTLGLRRTAGATSTWQGPPVAVRWITIAYDGSKFTSSVRGGERVAAVDPQPSAATLEVP